jgi:hypothetical protein
VVSAAAVQAKTGRTWAEWFRLLDAAGARQMDQMAIVAHLNQHHAIGAWWQEKRVDRGITRLDGA